MNYFDYDDQDLGGGLHLTRLDPRTFEPIPAPPRWPKGVSTSTGHKESILNTSNNIFGNMPGGNKFMDRMFRKADGVVWDMMTGRVGIQTKDDGIATLEGTGDDAQINLNLLDQFGMSVPAFAQSTPVAAVNVGDIIYFGATDRTGWVIDKKDGADPTKQPKFVLMKVDGTRTTWTAPKVTMLGMESGVMVLRSLMSMLPGGASGLQGMQNNMMMMMQMQAMSGDGGDFDMPEMIPLMLMGQMQAAPVVAADGTTVVQQQNPMLQMMMPMMMAKMFSKKNDSGFGGNGRNHPFSKG
jgi:hypothetical protein